MNNSELSISDDKNSPSTSKISLSGMASFDLVNLKVANVNEKIYKLIQCEKSKINDYNYIISKIIPLIQNVYSYSIVLFIKLSSRDDIKITSEEEWQMLSFLELIDSRNTLKIEYNLIKSGSNAIKEIFSSNSNDIQNDEIKLKQALFEKDLGIEVLKTIFYQVLKDNTIKNKLKQEIIKTKIAKSDNLENIINSNNFDSMLVSFLEKTIDKYKIITKIKNSNKNNSEDQNFSEIEFDENNETENQLVIPSFSQYYKDEELELFRTKLISETFSNLKKI